MEQKLNRPYVSLHNHSHFSILDSLISPHDLFSTAKQLGQKAVAITDHASFACVWDAYKAAKDSGVKYIVGCEFYFVNNVREENRTESAPFRHIILLARNATGYKNLLLLNRSGFDHTVPIGKRNFPVIDWDMLQKHSEGVTCLTSCGSGIVSQLLMNKKFDEAEKTVLKLVDIFGPYLGLEIQPNNLKRFGTPYSDSIDQYFINYHTVQLAGKLNIKIVPTSNAHYLKKEDHDTHDVMLAIGSGQPRYSNNRIKYNVPNFFLHTGDEVFNFLSRSFPSESVEEWIQNTVLFADQCEVPDWVDLKYSNPAGKELPIFPVQDQLDLPDYQAWLVLQEESIRTLPQDKSYLRYVCDKAFSKFVPVGEEALYRERLKEEFEVLEFHGFSSYMLIVSDFVKWARNNDVLIGAGRGSVGGCLIAYLVGIHQADPIKYKLIFARFLNKFKTDFPDIDMDFAPSGRDRVKEYIVSKYGEDYIAHVSNVNTITPKVYARDIARACEFGGSRAEAVKKGNDIAGAVPDTIKSVEKAFIEAPLFAEYALKYPELKRYSSISSKYRAWATHAGGLIIAARPLRGLVPLRKDKDGTVAIEYDKERAEAIGLVKMDLLGSTTLDIIKDTYDLIEQSGKTPPPSPLPTDDQATYDLLSRGDTFGVFQLGTSGGTIDLCRKVQPRSIEDISAINSLARPAARDIREDYVKTKNGEKKVKLLHSSLERAFGATYGFGLYEECLMYLAQDVAGWDLHEADRLRKLTKEKGKNPKKAAQWRLDFISDAQKNKNISEAMATKIWDEIIALFSGYGFNASHSILYSLTSYQTAYLKAHYPVEFLLANLKSEVRSGAKIAKNNIEKIKSEIRKHNVTILPPNLNSSTLAYTIGDENTLITGFDALKFVGDEAILDILNKRPFGSFFDFMVRVDSKAVRANTIQALAATGCLDSFGISRKQIYLYCSDYRKKLQTWLKRHDPTKEEFQYPWPETPDWSMSEKYALEKMYLGEAFSCTKRHAYGTFFQDRNPGLINTIRSYQDRSRIPSMKAEIKSVFEFKVKKEKSKFFGQDMVKATIEDIKGERCTLTIFPEGYTKLKSRLKDISSRAKFEEGIAIHFSGTTNVYEDEIGIILEDVFGFAPSPSVPADLKAKQVSLKKTKVDAAAIAENNSSQQNLDPKDLFIEIEDDLFDEGLLEWDDSGDLDNE